ncbi:MAG: hypothetical protein HEQ38_20470 [Gemmatimonas sp.]|nr:hypothetical protein [Gemmatimonas sp.]
MPTQSVIVPAAELGLYVSLTRARRVSPPARRSARGTEGRVMQTPKGYITLTTRTGARPRIARAERRVVHPES